jgi:hypothetical protein
MLVALMRTIRLSGMVFPALTKSLTILCSLVGIQCVIAGVYTMASTHAGLNNCPSLLYCAFLTDGNLV